MCFSSNHLGSLGFYRDRVAAESGEAQQASLLEPTEPSAAAVAFSDVHIASSCLQKALRRGELNIAWAAARYLLHADPERLWRRLCVVAFEDFGLVDLSVTARVVAVAASKAFRIVQGEERVLGHLIGLLCGLPKDRRLDDLYALGVGVLADSARQTIVAANPLSAIVAPLVHETSRLIARCERTVPRRSFRSISPDACERALGAMAKRGLVDDGLFELCAKGVRLSRCLLPVLLPLAIEATEAAGGLGEVVEQDLPAVPLIFGVPAYAIDGFTRGGRAILARLGSDEPRLKQLLAQLPASARLDVLHHLLFFAEGGRCNVLISDSLSQALYCEAVACGARLPHEAATAAVALMAELLPSVHARRAAYMAGLPGATASALTAITPDPTHKEHLS